jgi:hypothetical protein
MTDPRDSLASSHMEAQAAIVDQWFRRKAEIGAPNIRYANADVHCGIPDAKNARTAVDPARHLNVCVGVAATIG